LKHDSLDPERIKEATLQHLIEHVGAVFLLTILSSSYRLSWVLDHRILARTFVGAARDTLAEGIIYEKVHRI
jgi:hypothetical protein